MEKEHTKEELVTLYTSLYKTYSKSAATLRKRISTMNETAEYKEKQAIEYKAKLEAYTSALFNPGDQIIISGTHTGKGDLDGTIISQPNMMNDKIYYTVSAFGEKYFVAQHHLKKQ